MNRLIVTAAFAVSLICLAGYSKYMVPEETEAASVKILLPQSSLTAVSPNIDILAVDADQLAGLVPQNISQADFTCLAQAVYFEARSEPLSGQVAVASVVLNRTKHKRYPNNICGVVFQNDHRRNRCQFSFACDGRSDTAYNKSAWNKSKRVAAAMLTERYSDVTSNSMFYHATYVSPRWAKSMQPTVQIGTHLFYDDES